MHARSRNLGLILFVTSAIPVPAQVAPGTPRTTESVIRELRQPAVGVVVDEFGAAVRGARVEFRIENSSVLRPLARDEILRRQPLPVAYTDKDGGFVLPLTDEQRSLHPYCDGEISLVVRKEGMVPWIEPLAGGLSAFAGSRVELRRFSAADQFEIKVKDPRPGMLLLVSRQVHLPRHEHFADALAVPVPADGVVKGHFGLLPSPLVLRDNVVAAPVGRQVQLLFPGVSTPPILLPTPCVGAFEIAAADVGAQRSISVVGPDRAPAGKVSALYQCADGVCRWFDLPASEFTTDSHLSLLAVVAPGFAPRLFPGGIQGNRSIELEPLAGATAPTIRLVTTGDSLHDVSVRCHPLEDLTRQAQPPQLGSRQRATAILKPSQGVIEVPAGLSRKPHVLVIEARGHLPELVPLPLSDRNQKVHLTPAPAGSKATFRFVRGNRPLAGAFVRLPDDVYSRNALRGPICTDADGKLVIEAMPQGQHQITVCASTSWVSRMFTCKVKAGTPIQVTETVEPATVALARIEAGAGKPAPFVMLYANVNYQRTGQLLIHSRWHSDSLGRLTMVGIPEGGTLSVRPNQFGNRVVRVSYEEPTSEIEVAAALGRTVAMQLAVDPKARVRAVHAYLGGTRSQISRFSTGPGVAKTCDWIVANVPRDGGDVSLMLERSGAPPLSFGSADIAAGTETGGLTILKLGAERVVPIEVTSAAPFTAGDLRLHIPINTSVPFNFYDSLSFPIGRANGTFEFRSRSASGVSGYLIHPDCLPLAIDIPSAAVMTKNPAPVKVKLEPGQSVTLKLGKGPLPTNQSYATINLREQGNNGMVCYVRQMVCDLPIRRTGDGQLLLTLPSGVKPGKYRLYVTMTQPQVRVSNVEIDIEAGKPFVHDCSAPAKTKPAGRRGPAPGVGVKR